MGHIGNHSQTLGGTLKKWDACTGSRHTRGTGAGRIPPPLSERARQYLKRNRAGTKFTAGGKGWRDTCDHR